MRRDRTTVCHVITRMIVGGAQENTMYSCAHVDPDRFASLLVTGPETGPEGSLHEEVKDLGIRTIVLPSLVRAISPGTDAAALAALVRLFRRERPHIVHTHSSKAGILGRLAARIARVPAIVHTVHGWSFHDHMPAWKRAAYIRAERAVSRSTDRLVFVTERDRRKGSDERIGDADRYVTIRSGIDVDAFRLARSERREARRRLSLPDDVPVVGSVTRLSQQKDPRTFVAAAALVANRSPEARFVLVGDGPLRDELRAAAQKAGLGERITFAGLRRDVPHLLPAFDVFVLTSLWEGLPRVIPQAMAAQIPVVAAGVDGVLEAIVDGETGLLYRPGDPAHLADAVLRVLAEPALAERLAASGADRAEVFSLETMIADLERLYEGLGAGPGARAGDDHRRGSP